MEQQCTIIIPTFNRPDRLRRLLHYYSNKQITNPFLILDSSNPVNKKINLETLNQIDLDLRYEYFDVRTPFEKFLLGMPFVLTEFCVFCADDDVLLPEAVDESVQFLRDHSDYSLCHGYYFNFSEDQNYSLLSVDYTGKGIDGGNPLRRVYTLMSRFEATFYGVHRTRSFQAALAQTKKLELLLYKELVVAAWILVSGKSHRLPRFYCGRNTEAILSHSYWHPHEILAKSPQLLFKHYIPYRKIIVDALAEVLTDPISPEDIEKGVDLGHLKYLSQFLNPPILDFMIDKTSLGISGEQISNGIWENWVHSNRFSHKIRDYGPPSKLAILWRNIKKNIRDRISEPRWQRFCLRYLDPYTDYRIRSESTNGIPRENLIFDEFLFPTQGKITVNEESVRSIIQALDALPTLKEIRSTYSQEFEVDP